MCWGAFCASPSFGDDLTWDDPDENVKAARRVAAGCGTGNRCLKRKNKDYRGEDFRSCDEYPFASTSDSSIENKQQVTRCVPKFDNRCKSE